MRANVPAFPLIDQPWIPVIDFDHHMRVVSLRELFAESHRLRSVAGDLPTQTFSLTRLLLAILHRSVDGPPDERAWRRLWRADKLPIIDIEGYLDAFRDRFDLFHPATPFYQVADLRTGTGEVTGLERIIADAPNGFPYLTSRVGKGLSKMSAAEAARWLVHCQAFDTSGIKSGAVGDSRVKGGKGYPIGPGLCGSIGGICLEGRTLRETLLLNLIPLDSDYLHQGTEDTPVWERPPQTAEEEPATTRGPFGVLNLYTWQSRRIRLFGDETAITGALVANGDRFEWDNRHHLEPMTRWRRSPTKEKLTKLPQVFMPGQHDPTRALWRGLHALLPSSGVRTSAEGPAGLVPPLVQWLARTRNAGYVEAGFRVTTSAVGVVYRNQQSVIDQIYHDSLTLNIQAFDPASDMPALIMDCASDAESAVKALKTLASSVCRAGGGTSSKSSDPPAAAATRAAELAFARLDPQFRGWLTALDADSDPATARARWQQTIRGVLVSIGSDLVQQAGPTAWAGRAVDKDHYLSSPQADMHFRRTLNRLLPLSFATAPTTSTEPIEREDVPA